MNPLNAKMLHRVELRGSKGVWPYFKWSCDDQYVARMETDSIVIYDMPSMKVREKLDVPGVKEICWATSTPVLTYYVPETSNKPANVVMYDVTKRDIKTQKNLWHITDVIQIFFF